MKWIIIQVFIFSLILSVISYIACKHIIQITVGYDLVEHAQVKIVSVCLLFFIELWNFSSVACLPNNKKSMCLY